jgi:ATP-dependent protease ClpP protease subunit
MTRILNRLAGQPWLDIRNETAVSADVYIYGVIGDDWDGNGGAKEYVPKIRALKGKTIDLRINSPGGSVFDAAAIVSALAGHDAPVVAHIEGLAASAASWIALAAGSVRMSSMGRFMIHNASAFSWGDHRSMRNTADLLEGLTRDIANVYLKRSNGKTLQAIRDAMDAETWLNAADAKAWGFVDEVVESVKPAKNFLTAEIANALGFRNAPKTEPDAPVINQSPAKPTLYFKRRLELSKRLANP